MAISLRQARPYLTSNEAELVHWSTSKRVEGLPPARLRQKLDRARKLRDKYRGLAERQRREARRKQDPRGQRPAEGNKATAMKQQLFSETAERFEKALEAAGAPLKQRPKKTERKAAKKVSKKTGTGTETAPKKVTGKKVGGKKVSKKKVASKATPPKTPRKKLAAKKVVAKALARKKATRRTALSEATERKRKQTAMLKGGRVRFQGHVSSRGRRNQAKRDSRGRR